MNDPWAEANESDSYYVSVTDMLIGLLFLFIIMLMYFAVQLRTTTEALITADQTRSELLGKMVDYMQRNNVKAEADFEAGVLRLPNEILFEKSRDNPNPAGERALRTLAAAFAEYLPCYAFSPEPRPERCGAQSPHRLEAIFIEGHTDSDPLSGNERLRDNWDLSAARAANTYRLITAFGPQISTFRSAPSDAGDAKPLMSVAGYADQRPVASGDDEASKARNRRIDIRFLMAGPKPTE